MRRFFLILIFFTTFSTQLFAQTIRSTTFDERPICEQAKGSWRQFGNGCVDECRPKLDPFSVCTRGVNFGCDCGQGRCWNGDTCIAMSEYKKIYAREQEEEEKILQAAKERRKAEAEQTEQSIVGNLISKLTGVDKTNSNIGDFVKTEELQAPAAIPVEPAPATNITVGQTATQAAPTTTTEELPPIPGIPGITPEPATAQPKVPPLFLQQEQSKQAQTTTTTTTSSPAATTTTTTTTPPSQSGAPAGAPPGLPEIPLPN